MRFVSDFLFSGKKRKMRHNFPSEIAIYFIYKMSSVPNTSTQNNHLCTYFVFYEYDKHFRAAPLCPHMNGRMNEYIFFCYWVIKSDFLYILEFTYTLVENFSGLTFSTRKNMFALMKREPNNSLNNFKINLQNLFRSLAKNYLGEKVFFNSFVHVKGI